MKNVDPRESYSALKLNNHMRMHEIPTKDREKYLKGVDGKKRPFFTKINEKGQEVAKYATVLFFMLFTTIVSAQILGGNINTNGTNNDSVLSRDLLFKHGNTIYVLTDSTIVFIDLLTGNIDMWDSPHLILVARGIVSQNYYIGLFWGNESISESFGRSFEISFNKRNPSIWAIHCYDSGNSIKIGKEEVWNPFKSLRL